VLRKAHNYHYPLRVQLDEEDVKDDDDDEEKEVGEIDDDLGSSDDTCEGQLYSPINSDLTSGLKLATAEAFFGDDVSSIGEKDIMIDVKEKELMKRFSGNDARRRVSLQISHERSKQILLNRLSNKNNASQK
jgi:hypothetical protein